MISGFMLWSNTLAHIIGLHISGFVVATPRKIVAIQVANTIV